MSSSWEDPLDAQRWFALGRTYWLPPDGHGDDLEALTWAQLARLPHALAENLLAALATARIPTWIAPVHPHGRVRDQHLWDVWVATIEIDHAEDVAMRVLAASGDTES